MYLAIPFTSFVDTESLYFVKLSLRQIPFTIKKKIRLELKVHKNIVDYNNALDILENVYKKLNDEQNLHI